jgi:Fe-S-cluster containining protein
VPPQLNTDFYVVMVISLLPIPARIHAVKQELTDLRAYPAERLATIVKEVGFRCNFCAKCCTRAFNGHVFLLDRDAAAVKEIDPRALEPAPYAEFCDQNGTFYVSGFALRVQEDEAGSCYFLKNGQCRIYDRRFSICRIYPYMLHREPDEKGKVDWRQVSGLDDHGEYNTDIPGEECLAIARETKEYEEAYLMQEIGFLIFMQDYFARHRLRHVQKAYDDQLRRFNRGEEITVMVYYDGLLEQHRILNIQPRAG